MKIKDTKIGAMLKSKAPEVLDLVGDLLPDKGALGIIKNIIEKVSPEKATSLNAQISGLEKEFLADIKNARDMYKNSDHSMADSIANKIINWNLWLLLLLVAIQVYVIMFVEGQVAAVVTGIVGTITGALINERNTVVNFFFGSSKGSKDKDL